MIAFNKYYNHFNLLSSILIVVSLLLLIFKGLNFGIDFKGGTLIEVSTNNSSIGELRDILSPNFNEVSLQEFGDDQTIIIRLQNENNQESIETVNKVKQLINEKVSEFRRSEFVGPTVSSELLWKGFQAVSFALMAILISMWLRFEWQFGFGAVVALTHDVLFTLGVLSILNVEFSLSTIAAVLTIAGYSINDTVVIFDRVRENLRKYSDIKIFELTNISINETLSRTLITSITTLLALLSIFFFGGDISPALLAVGFIVRLNIAVLIFIGGSIGWLIGIPLLGSGLEFAAHPADGAWELWSTKIRYVGVGAMVIGGMASIFKVRKGLVDAIKVLRKTQVGSSQKNIPLNERNIPAKAINMFSAIAIILVGGVYFYITNNIVIAAFTTIIMIIMAFFFTAVASYIVGLVGHSNSPVSGMTITAVLFTGGLLYIFGFSGTEGMVATLGVAAIVCCAACTSGDVCNDLKTGQIVGASPYRQQIMQIAGVAVASLVMAPIMQLLHENTPGGIGGRELAAPQAGLFASLAKGFFGDGILPWNMVLIGCALGAIILVIDYILETKSSSFRLYLMPVAVGIYLPFGLSTPILIGGLMAHFILSENKSKAEPDSILQRGILLSSGLIAGESLMGILLAFIAGAGLQNLDLILNSSLVSALTFVIALITIYWLYVQSKPKTV